MNIRYNETRKLKILADSEEEEEEEEDDDDVNENIGPHYPNKRTLPGKPIKDQHMSAYPPPRQPQFSTNRNPALQSQFAPNLKTIRPKFAPNRNPALQSIFEPNLRTIQPQFSPNRIPALRQPPQSQPMYPPTAMNKIEPPQTYQPLPPSVPSPSPYPTAKRMMMNQSTQYQPTYPQIRPQMVAPMYNNPQEVNEIRLQKIIDYPLESAPPPMRAQTSANERPAPNSKLPSAITKYIKHLPTPGASRDATGSTPAGHYASRVSNESRYFNSRPEMGGSPYPPRAAPGLSANAPITDSLYPAGIPTRIRYRSRVNADSNQGLYAKSDAEDSLKDYKNHRKLGDGFHKIGKQLPEYTRAKKRANNKNGGKFKSSRMSSHKKYPYFVESRDNSFW